MVMRGAILQALVGVAIGIHAAMLCVRVVKSQLYEVKGVDTAVMAGAVFTLMAAAALAG
jgi:macrolide transport system ATP-binding/permease protein